MTKVSVIVPIYNRAPFIERCIKSILLAGYENIELLVVDDGSHDGSLELIREIESNCPRMVRVLTHPDCTNRGVSASRNLGIDSATGDYICFLDSDDLMLPGRFDTAVGILDAYPSIDGVYEAAEVFSDIEESVSMLTPGGEMDFSMLGEIDFEPTGMIHTGGILVRRSIFNKAGFFDTNRWVGEDIHMWLCMFAVGRLVPGLTKKPVVRYYKHSGNTAGFDVALVELDVIADVYKWARSRNVEKRKLRYLAQKYWALFYYYLSMERKEGLGFRKEANLLMHAFRHFPGDIFDRQYLANLYRLVIRAPANKPNSNSDLENRN